MSAFADGCRVITHCTLVVGRLRRVVLNLVGSPISIVSVNESAITRLAWKIWLAHAGEGHHLPKVVRRREWVKQGGAPVSQATGPVLTSLISNH